MSARPMKRQGTTHSSRALGSRVSGVRSDQPATGLRNKELSKGQEIDRRTWPKSVLCSIQLRGLAGWKGLLSAVCLSLLSLLLAK